VCASEKGRGEEKGGGKEEVRFQPIFQYIYNKKVRLLDVHTVPFMEYHSSAVATYTKIVEEFRNRLAQ
jgi:hypothetical protein